MSAEFYNQGDILNTSAMLGGKLILIKGNIVSVHYKTKDYCRYGLELVDVDETTYKIIEEYVSAKIGATWTKKVKKFI